MNKKKHLMDNIKMFKNKDLKKVEFLCGNLLELANLDEDYYARAFAHTYLADALVLQRKHSSAIQHLKEAQNIAEDFHYYDLLLLIYNIGGIYYKSNFDEITAIKYYLDAYNLANETNNHDEKLMTLNNISVLFSDKKDFVESLSYIKQAYQIFIDKGNIIKTQRDLIVIANLIQLYIFNGMKKEAIEVYNQYKNQINDFPRTTVSHAVILMSQIYLAEANHDKDKVNQIIDYFLEDAFLEIENRTISFPFFSDLYDITLKNKERERAEKLLQSMGENCFKDDIEQQLRLHLCWIRFAETFHMEDTLIQAYKQYYLLQKMVSELLDKNKAESMKEKIILNHMIKEREVIEQEKRALEAKIKIDELTRLFNRSYFNQLCKSMHENCGVTSLGYVIIDIDYFKEYNDYYGHILGDELLKSIARCLDENGDSRFFAARFGGDEFVCLCVNVDKNDVTQYLERVYQQLQDMSIEHIKSRISNIATISSGYSIFVNDSNFNHETSLMLADTALYKAKQNGRNRYIEYGSDL